MIRPMMFVGLVPPIDLRYADLPECGKPV